MATFHYEICCSFPQNAHPQALNFYQNFVPSYAFIGSWSCYHNQNVSQKAEYIFSFWLQFRWKDLIFWPQYFKRIQKVQCNLNPQSVCAQDRSLFGHCKLQRQDKYVLWPMRSLAPWFMAPKMVFGKNPKFLKYALRNRKCTTKRILHCLWIKLNCLNWI